MNKRCVLSSVLLIGLSVFVVSVRTALSGDGRCGPFMDGTYGYEFSCELYYPDGCPTGYMPSGEQPGCCQYNWTPIAIDLDGFGIFMTNVSNGVLFDINGSGRKVRTSWLSSISNTGWLVLDRNNNGTIDNGTELFGSYTPQSTPASGMKNGFLALAVYDRPDQGGNGDGKIDAQDAVFSRLRLWVDRNVDGLTTPNELYTLASRGILSISLDYQISRYTDQYGNIFRYRARIRRQWGGIDRWAWDIFPRLQ